MDERQKINLPPEFLISLKKLLGEEASELIDSLSKEVLTSIRYNFLKDLYIKPGEQVPWCSHARYLAYRPQFTLDPLFHAGVYYVQEASSMLLYEVMNLVSTKDSPAVLDLCAAPGGKSTVILDYLKGRGILVSNETIKSRCNPLMDNIKKWAYTNVIITNNDASDFARSSLKFDIILVDAPCSGEGMFRKSENAIDDWSEDNVALCSSRQRRIVADVMPCLKDGGIILYSTCTFNEQENIDNVSWMCDEFNLESLSLTMNETWGITEVIKLASYGYQCFPHKTKGEGFFIAALKLTSPSGENNFVIDAPPKRKLRSPDKKEHVILEQWIEVPNDHTLLMTHNGQVYLFPSNMVPWVETCLDELKLVYSGLKCGKLEKGLFIPEHALALSTHVTKSIPRFEMDEATALLYLRKQLQVIDSPIKSWMLATHKGFSIGWLKNLGNRINNYLPVEWMVRM